MVKGKQYLAVRPLPVFDSDECVPAGIKLTVISRDEVATDDGIVYRLMALQANRPEWFMQETGVFHPTPVRVPTLKELTWEGVRSYPDLMREELYKRLTECNPRPTTFTIDTMSGMLADDTRIEMFKEGRKVAKLNHNERYCTFRPRGWTP